MASFQFDSLHQLFWMDGHGPYVWGCYAIALVAILFLVCSPIVRRRQFLREMRMTVRREQQRAQTAEGFTGSAETGSTEI